jgi:hypothetical protein
VSIKEDRNKAWSFHGSVQVASAEQKKARAAAIDQLLDQDGLPIGGSEAWPDGQPRHQVHPAGETLRRGAEVVAGIAGGAVIAREVAGRLDPAAQCAPPWDALTSVTG